MMRRGVILPAVLVTLAVGALIGTTALYFADAGRRAASAGLDATQVRALGWSAVQGAMAELAARRDDLLAGEPPQLTEQWVAFQTGGGRSGLFRLLPMGPEGDLAAGENGKLDLNHALEASIARLPGLDEQFAAAIVAARPLESLEDLLAIEGISREMVYGGDDEGGKALGAGQETSASQGVAEVFAGAGARPLADTSTVYSFDPNIQSGAGDAQRRGDRRLNLNVEYNERLGRALDDRFGRGAGDAVRQVMESGRTFQRDADIVAALRLFRLPAEEWAPLLDTLTTSDHEYLPGRVDVNVAPAEVLATLPGLSDEIARAIVDRRESLSPSARLSVTWPLTEDLLTPEQFQEAVDHLTTRSMQWRVRVEAGLTARGPTGFAASVDDLSFDEFGVLDSGDGTRLERRVVLEAVIDVASQRPRVAFLRDVTYEPLSRRLAAERGESRESAAPGARPSDAEQDPRVEHLVDLEMAPAESSRRGGPGPVAPAGGAAAEAVDPALFDEADAGAPGAGDEPEFVDRRRGRWTAGGGG